MQAERLRELLAHLEAAEQIACDLELGLLGFAWQDRFIAMQREARGQLARAEQTALATWHALSAPETPCN